MPEIDKKIPFLVNEYEIKLPVVIKESKHTNNPDIYFGLDIIDKKLYINGFLGMTTEAIILMFIKKIWHLTVHLPLILDYGTCANSNTIDRIL